jgi:hypothetical protein
MWPDDEGVIYIAIPAPRFLWGRFECYLLEILHEEVGYERGEWRTHGHTISLSVELPIECEVGSGQNMAEKC